MGMTIDEAIPILHDMYNYYNDTDIDAYVGFDREDNDAVEIALDTMRKYQKIEHIIKTAGIFAFDVPEIKRIAKVVKDGNKD